MIILETNGFNFCKKADTLTLRNNCDNRLLGQQKLLVNCRKEQKSSQSTELKSESLASHFVFAFERNILLKKVKKSSNRKFKSVAWIFYVWSWFSFRSSWQEIWPLDLENWLPSLLKRSVPQATRHAWIRTVKLDRFRGIGLLWTLAAIFWDHWIRSKSFHYLNSNKNNFQ